MGTSRTQKKRIEVICNCGCKTKFKAFPVYGNARIRGNISDYTTIIGENRATLYIPKYKRGHHPNCQKNQTGQKDPWNKGLKKTDHPSIGKIGFQKSKKHWNYNPDLNPDWFNPNFDYISFAKEYSKMVRVRGVKKVFGKFRDAILKRDKYTCNDCGYIWNSKKNPNLIHIHHKLPAKIHPELIFAPHNVVTLCRDCHWNYHRHK